MTLPARRQPPRSGIERAPRREWPRHRAFVRRHSCVVTLGIVHDECDGPIECCHRRTAENSGTALKPPDWETFSACRRHHEEQHAIGQPAFERKYGISLEKIAAEFARLSPDMAMKEVMRESGRMTEVR